MAKAPFNVVRAGWRNGGPRCEMLGFRPTCACPPHAPAPCVVLDPFAGAGTTLLAATRLGRCSVGIELGAKDIAIARRRIEAEMQRGAAPPARKKAA